MLKQMKSWEPQNAKRNTIIQIVILTLIFVMLARVWPYQCYHNHDWTKQQAFHPEKEQIAAEPFGQEDKKLQTVYFSKDHLYQMRVYLQAYEFDNKDRVLFRLYDENFSCIYEEEFGCNLIARDGFVQPVTDMDVAPGQAYYYEIIVPQKETFWWMYTVKIGVPVASVSALGQEENGPLYIDGIINQEQALVADFDYGTSLVWWQILLWDLLILALGIALYIAVFRILQKLDAHNVGFGKKEKRILYVFSVLCFFVYIYFACIADVFGVNTTDKIVFGLGGLTGLFWAMYRIYIIGTKKEIHTLTVEDTISLTWRNAIQIVSFGLLFYALAMYVNAYVEYLHTNNTRWMLILMGIALLAVSSHKLLICKINWIWLAVSIPGGILYSLQHEAGQDRYLAKLTAAVVIIWGLVVLQIFLRDRKGVWSRLQKPYFLIWIAFILCTYVFRYEKTWVFTQSLPFLAILLLNLHAEEKKRLLQNFAQGILFSFWLITLYNLLHRPHHYWMYFRYSGIFHTVACTGLYLTVVIGVAFALLLGKWKNQHKNINNGFYELFTLVAAVNYAILSISRTALLAIAIDMILVMLASVWVFRKNFVTMCKEGIILLVLILSGFTLVFSAQRMIPALVNQPEYHRIENSSREFAIHEGEPITSEKYMTFDRFFAMFTGRVQTGDASQGLDAKECPEYMTLLASVNTDKLPVINKVAEEEEGNETTDFSNGRFDIFKLYLSKVSWKGNPGTILADDNGGEYAHAHNSFIMVFYNYGIIAGVLFIVLCVWTLIKALNYFQKNGKKEGAWLVPLSVVIVFGVTSLTEWTYHPCFAPGYAFTFIIPFLMYQKEKEGTE